jgi:hypothetical protein
LLDLIFSFFGGSILVAIFSMLFERINFFRAIVFLSSLLIYTKLLDQVREGLLSFASHFTTIGAIVPSSRTGFLGANCSE